MTPGLATPDVRGALRRLLVECERPIELSEWSHAPRATAHHGAVRVQDKHGDLGKVARAA